MDNREAREHEKMLSDALWKTCFYYWQDPGDRSDTVMIPPLVTVNGLIRALAYTISQVEDPKERRGIQQKMMPVVDRMVEQFRQEAKVAQAGLILPDDSPRIMN